MNMGMGYLGNGNWRFLYHLRFIFGRQLALLCIPLFVLE
jgi:hypothetical protein